jgi:hypothetical protein
LAAGITGSGLPQLRLASSSGNAAGLSCYPTHYFLQQDSRYQTPWKECLQLKGLQQTPYNVKEEKYTLQ